MKIMVFILLSPIAFGLFSQIGYLLTDDKYSKYAGPVWGVIGVMALWAFYFI